MSLIRVGPPAEQVYGLLIAPPKPLAFGSMPSVLTFADCLTVFSVVGLAQLCFCWAAQLPTKFTFVIAGIVRTIRHTYRYTIDLRRCNFLIQLQASANCLMNSTWQVNVIGYVNSKFIVLCTKLFAKNQRGRWENGQKLQVDSCPGQRSWYSFNRLMPVYMSDQTAQDTSIIFCSVIGWHPRLRSDNDIDLGWL